jgi:hypothetical protein
VGSSPNEVDFFFYFFDVPNPSSCTVGLGSTHPLTEMNTRMPMRKADSLTTIYEQLCGENVGTSTSYNLMGLHGLLQG